MGHECMTRVGELETPSGPREQRYPELRLETRHRARNRRLRHLMRTGRIEASLPALVAEHPLVDVADLLDRKLSGAERQPLDEGELEAHEQTYHGLVELLERARDDSHLPEEHDLFDRVDRLVREARLASL